MDEESVDDGSSSYLSEDEDQTSVGYNSGNGSSAVGEGESSSADERRDVDRMMRKESKDVAMWREIVTGMMVITGTVVTVATFILFSQSEVSQFVSGFENVAGQILESSRDKIKTIDESLFGLSDVLTSTGKGSDDQWPFVHLEDLDVHAAHASVISGLQVIWTTPLVGQSERGEWLNYSVSLYKESYNETIYDDIYFINNSTVLSVIEPGPYAPVHQVSPFPKMRLPLVNLPMNLDILRYPEMSSVLDISLEFDSLAVSSILSSSTYQAVGAIVSSGEKQTAGSVFTHPIHDDFENGTTVGYVSTLYDWSFLLNDVLSDGQDGFDCVLNNTCDDIALTWTVNGKIATFMGEGDLHDKTFQNNVLSSELPLYEDADLAQRTGACRYFLTVYPNSDLRRSYDSANTKIYTTTMSIIFFGLSAVFFLYDKFVQRRNDKVVTAAARSNKIVSSLFPAAVRDKLYAEKELEEKARKKSGNRWLHPKSGLSDFLQGEDKHADEAFMFETKPIADLFPDCTIMFADLVGFTAWSSVREPSQVFTLLETVYRAFDQIARRRKIFKVETVGDCYVAVAGLPEPRRDHAVAMAKFAFDCLKKVGDVTKKLEVALGPDTADLTVRVGLHSGPVTAGVLRGEKSRFQLFGDTMNTASRMESTGQRERIQMTEETANLLLGAGKTHWITAREDKVIAKGKGEMQTYWLNLHSGGSSNRSSSDNDFDGRRHDLSLSVEDTNDAVLDTKTNSKVQRLMGDKTSRLIDWNVDVLLSLLKQIVARRQYVNGTADNNGVTFPPLDSPRGKTVIDEVTEIITLPAFDTKTAQFNACSEDVTIDEDVVAELLDYVTNVAIMYNENPFHCFDHASHVCMSVTKLMSRIVAPSDMMRGISTDIDRASSLHDNTYGITSDPLTQFACVFSALIHDVDHAGVPNTVLVKEEAGIATMYKNKSVAEQNSVDLAWELLTDDSYSKLRHTIYQSEEEQRRFRQLVVNSVMATDIMDLDLKNLRNLRWEKAFDPTFKDDSCADSINRKATIVIEHLIQASDVAHTMQHWHIYRKWNERLFQENYAAYIAGRADSDPSISWYEGELCFFDFYIIPLAKKLKDCGVFGVSSAEYLNYAMVNRQEWEIRGQQITAEMVDEVRKEAKGKRDMADEQKLVMPSTPESAVHDDKSKLNKKQASWKVQELADSQANLRGTRHNTAETLHKSFFL